MQNESRVAFIQELRKSQFFSRLSEESLASLVTQAKEIHYDAGATIFGEGEPSRGLFWLHSGTLKAVKYGSSGKEQILHLVRAGHSFNEVGAFSTLPNPASVIALEAVHVWCIPDDVIRQQLQLDPAFSQVVIDILSSRLRRTVDLIEDLSLRPVLQRLSRLLLDESDGDTFFRPSWYTQYELAARLGTVEDVVQRSLRKLENNNLIEASRQEIRIIDRIELEKLAS